VKLGVRLPNWLGDALLARRALDALAGARGEGELVIAAPRAIAGLLAHEHPGATWVTTGHGLAAAGALAAAWRRAAIDRAVVFPTSLSSRLAARRSGARERIGLGPRPAGRRESAAALWLTCRVARGPRGERHLEDEYGDLAAAAGAAAAPRRRLVPPAAAAGFAANLATSLDAPYIAVAPGARYGPAKRWPADRVARAAELAASALGAPRVLLVGDLDDAEACARVGERLTPGAVDLCGRTDLPTLAGILAGARVVLANDSGAAHLAAAVGAPTVVLFGSTDPRWTAPRGEAVRVLWHRLRCAPCFRRACPWTDAYACLRLLEPEDAAAALVALAERGSA
jgi:heptosyltransferase-2